MINHKERRSKGFTIIELTLVMAAMSILLLAVLYATLQAGALYDKGITNRTVNQLSRDISDTIRRDFTAVDASMVKTFSGGTGDAQSGRLCLGTVSYLWNTAALLNTDANGGIKDSSGKKQVTFVRVDDPGQIYCTQSSGAYPTTIDSTAKSTSLFSGDGRSFAVYSLKVTPLTDVATSAQGVFDITMTIGTNEPGTTRSTGGATQCKPSRGEGNEGSDFNYCSIVDLDIIVRAGGNI